MSGIVFWRHVWRQKSFVFSYWERTFVLDSTIEIKTPYKQQDGAQAFWRQTWRQKRFHTCHWSFGARLTQWRVCYIVFDTICGVQKLLYFHIAYKLLASILRFGSVWTSTGKKATFECSFEFECQTWRQKTMPDMESVIQLLSQMISEIQKRRSSLEVEWKKSYWKALNYTSMFFLPTWYFGYIVYWSCIHEIRWLKKFLSICLVIF